MATSNLPAFAKALQGLLPEDRLQVLKRVHAAHATHSPSWHVLLDAFEGKGGFLDGSYLWPYAREEQQSYEQRMAMARYHNYLEALVDLYVRFMFTNGVKRECANREYLDWLEDVDGAGTHIDDLLKQLASVSLVGGHAGCLIDKTQDEAEGPTKAEERARVVASVFAAPCILDWRFKDKVLSAVKLEEGAPEIGIAEKGEEQSECHYLIWDDEGWARYDGRGELVGADTPGLGMVPLVVLRPKPSQLDKMLGRPLVSNANVIRALFNRAAEEDQVLRDQAFSLLTVEVDESAKVEETKASIGNSVGTAKAIVVKGKVKYETPDMNVPGAIRDNISYLVQEIYRAAHVRYSRESLAAESGESIRLQYTELNEMLQGFAKSLAAAEQQICRAWFAWQTPDETRAQEEFERSGFIAQYPDEFFLDALMVDLEAWAKAAEMNLGPTMGRRIKKKAVRRIDPDIPPEELEVIDGEIDAMKPEELNPGLAMSMMELEAGPDTGNPARDEGV